MIIAVVVCTFVVLWILWGFLKHTGRGDIERLQMVEEPKKQDIICSKCSGAFSVNGYCFRRYVRDINLCGECDSEFSKSQDRDFNLMLAKFLGEEELYTKIRDLEIDHEKTIKDLKDAFAQELIKKQNKAAE